MDWKNEIEVASVAQRRAFLPIGAICVSRTDDAKVNIDTFSFSLARKMVSQGTRATWATHYFCFLPPRMLATVVAK
ncbi:MAG: hypothetical protein P4L90_13805 [Rhodopila sp.]|nr:hypothetical protein [Rhodopila sp.]